jgi:hypothetical protein
MKSYSLRLVILIVLISFNLIGCDSATKKSVSSSGQASAKLLEKKLVDVNKDKITIGNGNQVAVVQTHGNYKTFDSEDELFQFVDLVVIGKPTINLDETSYISSSESEAKSKKYPDNVSIEIKNSAGLGGPAFSIVLFKVQKYLKGNLKEKQIRVLQTAAYLQEPGRPPFVQLTEGASPLQKKSRYVLFLKELDPATYPNLAGVYGVMSVNQGKFNFDKTDSQESEVEGSDEQYRKLKEKVKKRHESDFDSTPDV